MSADPQPLVVTLGETMVSFIARERGPMVESSEFLRTIAGSEANMAVGIARLGGRAAYIGRVGADGLGTTVSRRLRAEGVDVSHLRIDETATTGTMVRELRDLGPAEVVYWRAGSAGSRLSAADVEAAGELIDGAAWLHVTGITPALSPEAAGAVDAAVERAQAAGVTISIDLNVRRHLWSEAQARAALAPLVTRCDVVLGGVEELAVVAGLARTLEAGTAVDPVAAADAVRTMGPATVVVKLGADGALERRVGISTSVPALPVEHVIDPVGAGDAFTAGYVSSVLEGAPATRALTVANACGAAAVSVIGDIPGMPTRAELELLLARGNLDTLR